MMIFQATIIIIEAERGMATGAEAEEVRLLLLLAIEAFLSIILLANPSSVIPVVKDLLLTFLTTTPAAEGK